MPKDRWQNENISLDNPFAALKKPSKEPESAPVAPVQKPAADQSADVLPKVKSARIERAQRGGKTVTVVTFHGNPSDAAKTAWLKTMKKSFGIGGTIEGENAVLQGDQRERLKQG